MQVREEQVGARPPAQGRLQAGLQTLEDQTPNLSAALTFPFATHSHMLFTVKLLNIKHLILKGLPVNSDPAGAGRGQESRSWI